MSPRLAIAVVCIALGALIAAPTASAARASGGGSLVNSLAAGACSAEKGKLGKKSFQKKYGKKHSSRNCAKRKRGEARSAVAKATTECQAELEDYGEEDFYADWETFDACVADYADWIMGGGTFEDDPDDTGDDVEDTGDDEEFKSPIPLVLP